MANFEVVSSKPVIKSVVVTLRPVEAEILVTVFEQYMKAVNEDHVIGAYNMTVPAWIEDLRAQGVSGAHDDDF